MAGFELPSEETSETHDVWKKTMKVIKTQNFHHKIVFTQ